MVNDDVVLQATPLTKEGSGELLITRFVLHADSIAANSAKSVIETITFFYIVLSCQPIWHNIIPKSTASYYVCNVVSLCTQHEVVLTSMRTLVVDKSWFCLKEP